jgi:GT2 family glycosyltransferase
VGPVVSLVVPGHGSVAELSRCLERIRHSDYPRQLIEIIVVVGVDSSNDSAHLAQTRGAVVVRAKGRLGDFLNHGARAALGDIVAFVYPHAELDVDWIGKAVSRLSNGHAAWLANMALAVRRAPFESVGGFDSTGGADEQLDLCNRLNLAGHLVVAADRRSRAAA